MSNKSKPKPSFSSGSTPQKKKQKVSTQSSIETTNLPVSHNFETFPVTQLQHGVSEMPDRQPRGSHAGATPGAAASGVGASSSPHSVTTPSLEAPPWFRAFEARLESRFDILLAECREKHASMELDIANLKDEVGKLTIALRKSDEKVDELENRSRRNNIVLFNVPEHSEGDDCIAFVKNLLKDAGCPEVKDAIQRAHRSGRPSREENPRPRPVHVGFSTYVSKEKARKSLIEFFKGKGKKDQHAKFFVSHDYSRRVQQMRREKLPMLKKLKEEGKNVFMVYPAIIRIRDSVTGQYKDV